MKIGVITTPNAKGQIVIPKKIRDAIGLRSDTPLNIIIGGGGIYMYPIREAIGEHEVENSYLKVLEKTAGSWNDDWEGTRKRRRKIELSASERNKNQW